MFLPFCKETTSLHKILTFSSNLNNYDMLDSYLICFSSYKEKGGKHSEVYLLKYFSSFRAYSNDSCKSIMPFCKINIAMSLGRDCTCHSNMMHVEGV